MIETTNAASIREENALSADSIKEKIPRDRYRQIRDHIQQARLDRAEAQKALKFMVEKGFDPDTAEANFSIIIDKVSKAVKHEVIAGLMKDNWRVS